MRTLADTLSGKRETSIYESGHCQIWAVLDTSLHGQVPFCMPGGFATKTLLIGQVHGYLQEDNVYSVSIVHFVTLYIIVHACGTCVRELM